MCIYSASRLLIVGWALLSACSATVPDKPLSIVPGTRRTFIIDQLGPPLKSHNSPDGRTKDTYLTKHGRDRAWPIDRTLIEYDRAGNVVGVTRTPMPPSKEADLRSLRTVRVNGNLDTTQFGLTPDQPMYPWFRSLYDRIIAEWAYGGRYVEKDDRPVNVKIIVASDGQLIDVTVTKSSGLDDLDQHVVDSIRKVAPFEPFPPSIREQSQIVNMNFHNGVSAYLGFKP